MLGLLGVSMTSCVPADLYGPAPAPLHGSESLIYHPSERVEDGGVDVMDDSETDNENHVEE